MDEKELILKQYKLYSKQKESFIERSFFTNKFYLILVLILTLVIFLTKDYTLAFGVSTILVFGLAGTIICFLWWVNIDSYNFLIKIKLAKVLEVLEKQLPVQPYATEFEAICDFKKNKREFLFADVQKILAILFLLFFLILSINEVLLLVFT